jgi:hypothetical protein
MLDLKELERKLDLALSLENSGSLKTWLFSKRNEKTQMLLGEGIFLNCLTQSFSFNNTVGNNSMEITNSQLEESYYSLMPIAA